jgi:hypothetical protein
MAITGFPLPQLAMKAVGIPATPVSMVKPARWSSVCKSAVDCCS